MRAPKQVVARAGGVLAPEATRPVGPLEVKDVATLAPGGLQLEQKAAQVAEAVGVIAADPDDDFTFTIIGSVTGIVDEVKDIIQPGAYAATLRKRTPKVIKGHDWGQPLGKVLEIEELLPGDSRLPKTTSRGEAWPSAAGALLAKVRLFKGTSEGRDAAERWREYGPEQEFSIGYVVPPGQSTKRPDGVRSIKTLDCYEISDVLWGAMPLAGPLPANLAVKTLAGAEVEAKASAVLLAAGADADLDGEPSALEVALHEAGMPEVDWTEVELAAGAAVPGESSLFAVAHLMADVDVKAKKGEAPKTFGVTAKPKASGKDESNSLPDGSFPIANKADLAKAVKTYFLAKDRAAAKRHIIKRARALDALAGLPDGWVKGEKGLGLVLEGKSAGVCKYGPEAATLGIVWANGSAMIKVCAAHEGKAREVIDAQADEVDEVRDLAGAVEGKALVLLPFDLEVKKADAKPGDGNATNLHRWYETGEGAAKIRWGTDGDLTRCQRLARKHMLADQAWGYCNLRHRAVLGTFNDPDGKALTGGVLRAETLTVAPALISASGAPLVPGYRPEAESGPLAGSASPSGFAGAAPIEDVIESKDVRGHLPGSYEERHDRLEWAVRELLQGAKRAAGSGNEMAASDRHEWDSVMIVATWDDRLIARRTKWDHMDTEETFEIAYSLDEAGEVTLGEPDEVRLEVTVVGQGPGDGSQVPPLDAVAGPVTDLVTTAAAGMKFLLSPPNASLEVKAGRVLSGANEERLRAAVEHLIGVLRAAGMLIGLAEGEMPSAHDAVPVTDSTAPTARTGVPAAVEAKTAVVDVDPAMVAASLDAFLDTLD